jgi:protocatechuate 3,4-dioxygenase beta subunit
VAELITIYPGSYAGRCVHIHFAIRKEAGSLPPQSGQSLPDIFVAQLYFTNEATTEIFAADPIYQQGAPITPNELDGIFAAGGADLMVDLTSDALGYIGEVTVPVRRSEIGL